MTPEEIPQPLVDILDRRAGKVHGRTGPVLAALAEILTHHEGRTMTTYDLDLTETNPGGGLHTTGGGPVSATLARLSTHDPAVMAATLRAVADRLDPPQKVTYRRVDTPHRQGVHAPSMPRLSDVCPNCIGDAHTYEPGRCALKPPWSGVVVADRYRGGVDSTMGPPAVIDAPGDRMDAPDAALSPAAAEAVARMVRGDGKAPGATP